MSTDKGYVMVYREIRNHWIWSDAEAFRAWIDLIMMANYSDTSIRFNGQTVDVPRGAFITSIRNLGYRWGWSRGRVTRLLDVLERDSMIATKRDSQKTTITIVNYDFYQSTKRKSEPRSKPRTEPRTEPQTEPRTGHSEYSECTYEYKEKKYIPLRGLAEYEPLTPEEIEAGGWE